MKTQVGAHSASVVLKDMQNLEHWYMAGWSGRLERHVKAVVTLKVSIASSTVIIELSKRESSAAVKWCGARVRAGR